MVFVHYVFIAIAYVVARWSSKCLFYIESNAYFICRLMINPKLIRKKIKTILGKICSNIGEKPETLQANLCNSY